jgi:hypothetical protein
MLCALIRNNLVVDVQNLTDEEIQAIVGQYQQLVNIENENPQPGIGWRFDVSHFEPPLGQDGHVTMIITRLAFRNRFTMAEKAALYTVAGTAPGIGLKVYLDDLASATFVDLSRTDTINSVNYLATLGIITPARAAAILTTPPTALEIYKG